MMKFLTCVSLLHVVEFLYMSAYNRTAMYSQALMGSPPHFFSLVKELICSEPEEKVTVTRVCCSLLSEQIIVLQHFFWILV